MSNMIGSPFEGGGPTSIQDFTYVVFVERRIFIPTGLFAGRHINLAATYRIRFPAGFVVDTSPNDSPDPTRDTILAVPMPFVQKFPLELFALPQSCSAPCVVTDRRVAVKTGDFEAPACRPGRHSRVTSKVMPSSHAHFSHSRERVHVRRVDECDTLDELIRHAFPAFGGAFLRRIYPILDQAIGMGCPLTLAVSGPVTVSGQHQAWLIPLLETGWVAYLSTTDAVCYHDGHRSLNAHRDPVFEVPIWGDDGALRDDGTIRVTDMAFDEEVLLDQDKFLTAVLMRPEFQQPMTGTELRYRLGELYAEQELANGVEAGLLSTCHRLAIPVFVGAPADGSVFLNSMKLWAMQQAGLLDLLQIRSGYARGSLRGVRVSPLGVV